MRTCIRLSASASIFFSWSGSRMRLPAIMLRICGCCASEGYCESAPLRAISGTRIESRMSFSKTAASAGVDMKPPFCAARLSRSQCRSFSAPKSSLARSMLLGIPRGSSSVRIVSYSWWARAISAAVTEEPLTVATLRDIGSPPNMCPACGTMKAIISTTPKATSMYWRYFWMTLIMRYPCSWFVLERAEVRSSILQTGGKEIRPARVPRTGREI